MGRCYETLARAPEAQQEAQQCPYSAATRAANSARVRRTCFSCNFRNTGALFRVPDCGVCIVVEARICLAAEEREASSIRPPGRLRPRRAAQRRQPARQLRYQRLLPLDSLTRGTSCSWKLNASALQLSRRRCGRGAVVTDFTHFDGYLTHFRASTLQSACLCSSRASQASLETACKLLSPLCSSSLSTQTLASQSFPSCACSTDQRP